MMAAYGYSFFLDVLRGAEVVGIFAELVQRGMEVNRSMIGIIGVWNVSIILENPSRAAPYKDPDILLSLSLPTLQITREP